jgi:hypothetical protein
MEKTDGIEAYPEDYNLRQRRQQQQVPTRKWWQLGGKDFSFVSVEQGYEDVSSGSDTASRSSSNHAVVVNRDNVYVAPEAVELYKPVEGFEGTHRFDPNASWSEEDEKRLVRRVSRSLPPTLLTCTCVSARVVTDITSLIA